MPPVGRIDPDAPFFTPCLRGDSTPFLWPLPKETGVEPQRKAAFGALSTHRSLVGPPASPTGPGGPIRRLAAVGWSRRFRQRGPSWVTIENKVAAACGGIDHKYRLTTSMEQRTPSPTADSILGLVRVVAWCVIRDAAVALATGRRGRRPLRAVRVSGPVAETWARCVRRIGVDAPYGWIGA